jgi:2-polyprenyl-3-methyl-5-hydroxy-6-metoxy-1,4-benzoquinol methylase
MNKTIVKFLKNLDLNQKNLLVIGPGKSTILSDIQLQSSFTSIDFVDHNQEALDFQKKLLCNNSNCVIHYHMAELSIDEPLDFLLNEYDLILCTEVIEHVDNNQKLLLKIHELLSNTGIFIISVPNKYIDKFLLRLNNNYMQTHDLSKGHLNFYNKFEFKNLLNNSGFEILKLNGIASEFVFFHFILVYFKVHIDEDTGQIYDTNNSAVKWGARLMRLILYFRLNYFLNFIIPRNYLAITKKSL